MVVLRREQSVNWPGFYIDVAGICQVGAGTRPAEAGIGPVEDGHADPRQLFGGRTRDGPYSDPRRCVTLGCISRLMICRR